MHLIIDGYGSNPDILQSEEFIYQLLDQYPAKIGMTRISIPKVLKYDGGDKPEEWGISGFVFIAESHISIHTFVETGYVNVDVFSCKSFDTDRAIDDITHQLRLVKVRTHFLDRSVAQFTHPGKVGEVTLLKPL